MTTSRCAKIRKLGMGAAQSPSAIARQKIGDFPELMRNRAVFGTCRYGDPRSDQVQTFDDAGHTGDDMLLRLKKKLAAFEATRNHEMLVDVAVYCALIFRFDDHPKAHFQAEDQGK